MSERIDPVIMGVYMVMFMKDRPYKPGELIGMCGRLTGYTDYDGLVSFVNKANGFVAYYNNTRWARLKRWWKEL